jgi:capsular polysaccharide biosynthesis protein
MVVLVATGVAVGALAGVLTETTYSSRSSLLVSANRATSTSELYTASVLATQRVPAYVEALQGTTVAEAVSDTIDGARSPSEVQDEVGVAVGAGGYTMTLTVSDPDADVAYAIANAYAAEATELIEDREQADAGRRPERRTPGMDLPALTVDVIDRPAVASEPTRPDWSLLLVLGALAGALAAGSVAVLRAGRLAAQREAAERARSATISAAI